MCASVLECEYGHICSSVQRGQKAVSHTLKLELQAIVSCLTWMLGPKSCLLLEQQALLAAEPPLPTATICFETGRLTEPDACRFDWSIKNSICSSVTAPLMLGLQVPFILFYAFQGFILGPHAYLGAIQQSFSWNYIQSDGVKHTGLPLELNKQTSKQTWKSDPPKHSFMMKDWKV